MSDPYEHLGWRFLAIIAGACAPLLVAMFAGWSVFRLFRSRRYIPGALCLLLGVLAVANWWIAGPFARRWAGWSDVDGDGMLDGFAAGAYDRVDTYGPHWGIIVLGGSIICVAGIVATRCWARRGVSSN